MASQIDITGLTLNAQEATDIGQLIIEQGLVRGELSEDHAIETGVLYQMQIPFAGRIADSFKKAIGCVPGQGTGFALTQKFWTPEIFATRFQHCAGDLNILLKIFKKEARINRDFYDKLDSEEMKLVIARIVDSMKEHLPTKVWFSERLAAIQPAGNFKIGTDLSLYNVINGLFQQIFSDALIKRFVVTANAGTTFALQALPVDGGFDILTNVFNNADSRLLQDPTAKILVTRSISDSYRNTLRNKNLGGGFTDVTENGMSVLRFEGREVKTRYDWDDNILALENNGTRLRFPHRAVFTTKENIPVGTLSESDLKELTSHYDATLKQNIIDVAFTLDAKMLESYMISVAY